MVHPAVLWSRPGSAELVAISTQTLCAASQAFASALLDVVAAVTGSSSAVEVVLALSLGQ